MKSKFIGIWSEKNQRRNGTELVVYVIEKTRAAEKDTRSDEYRNTGCVFAHRVTCEQHSKMRLSVSKISKMGGSERLFELVSRLRHGLPVDLGSRTIRLRIKAFQTCLRSFQPIPAANTDLANHRQIHGTKLNFRFI